ENSTDRRWVEGEHGLAGDRVIELPGAGVDPSQFKVTTEPADGLIVGLAARLVKSKGVDLAVAAITALRGRGHAISLRIAGASDPENPEHVDEAQVEVWRRTPGVSVLGRVRDINGFWAGAHIACLPSRGGEGLPRSLLEAAACGRPIVTTDVPGCADFVVD